MYIMPITANTYNNLQQDSVKSTINNRKVRYNPTFGVSLTSLYLMRKAIAGSRNGYKKAGKILEYKTQALNMINNAKEDIDKIHILVVELSKTNKELDEYGTYNTWLLWRKDTISMSEIRQQILTKIFPLLDDSNFAHQEAKKTYLVSLFNNSEHLTPEFFNIFKNLPNEQYHRFKMELLSRILFAREELKKGVKDKNGLVFNINLASALLPDEIGKNKEKIKSGIDKNVRLLYQTILNEYKGQENRDFAYVRYSEDFYDIQNNPLIDTSKFERILFNKILTDSKFNADEVSKKLNISNVELAKSIINDYKILAIVDKMNNKNNKIQLLTDYINEKINKDYNIEFFDDIYSSIIYTKIENIENFIKKTGDLKEILQDRFKPELDSLKKAHKSEIDYEEKKPLINSF